MKCVSVDGESIAPWGYCLLSSSSSDRLSEGRRLTSRECFDFLLSQTGDGVRLFGYGIGYDVCHWVADLTGKEKGLLATKGICYTQQGTRFYRLIYRPGAYFSVYLLKGLPCSYKGRGVIASATVVDLMKWHRKPFVDVCEEWLTDKWNFGRIRTMKEHRQQFDLLGKQDIEAYCNSECSMLSELGSEMTSRLKDLGIPCSHPFTAGSVAGALMAKHKVADHWREPPLEVSDAVSRAFFGGREQCSRYGYFQDVTQWDIRSAYGWAMTQLPDMSGTWYRGAPEYSSNGYPVGQWSICKVQWDIDEGRHPVMPFPWRTEDGRVHYPPRGTGWQWSPIVRSVIRNYSGANIRILDAFHYIPTGEVEPFGYVGKLFDARREAGSDPVSGLLKSIIVATWGRMCSPGQRANRTRGQLAWAGMTTALIQERMLDAIHSTGEDRFISACVDGFWTDQSSSGLETGKGIGEWSHSSADELLLLRPTCYWKRKGDVWSGHTSGIPGGTRLAAPALEQWRSAGWRRGRLDLSVPRCKGLLACSVDGDYDQLGKFFDLPLTLTFNPGMGRTGHECPTMKHGSSWRRWLSYWPPTAHLTQESKSFVSRTTLIDDRWKERREANAIEETME